MKKLMLGAAAMALLAGTANAAFVVDVAAPVLAIPTPGNDFKTDLNNEGLVSFAVGNTVFANVGRYKFEYLGSESGFTNVFNANGLYGGSVSYTEIDGTATFAAPINFGELVLGAGTPDFSFLSNGGGSPFDTASAAFSIFLPAGKAAGDSYVTNTLYIGFDDNTGNPDDNHDDFLVRVTAVPEPATWAMMIAGFGLVGGAMRRRAKASPSIRAVYS